MAGWQGWVDSMLAPDKEGNVWLAEAAICGISEGQEGLWASSPGFKNISPDEIRRLLKGGNDLHQQGPLLCGEKCQLLRNLLDSDEHCMDLKTKAKDEEPSCCVCIGKAKKCFVIAKGLPGVNAGKINITVNTTVERLLQNDY